MKIAVVGAGLSGATAARLLHDAGHQVEIFERHNYVGGHCATERDLETGIMVHKHGPHIFHTNNLTVWEFVQKFATFYPFILRMKSLLRETVFSAPPINLHTINQYLKTQFTPDQAKEHLDDIREKIEYPQNFEEAAVSVVGWELYVAFLRDYTIKQWGVKPTEIPAKILSRLPLRFNYDDNKYPSHEWQAIPADGYTRVIERMLLDIPVTFAKFTRADAGAFHHTFYTGPLDEWYGYSHGHLQYRTLSFEVVRGNGDLLGTPVMVYPNFDSVYTRATEHKHLTPWEHHDKTIVYYEEPRACEMNDEPFYPMQLIAEQPGLVNYRWLTEQDKNVTFLGRLATYEYIDMDEAIWRAMGAVKKFLKGRR